MERLLRIHPEDNVGVAPFGLTAGEEIKAAGCGLCAKQEVPPGHKLALRAIVAGESVVKYGFPIGIAACDIQAGDWVHTHNLHSALTGREQYDFAPAALPQLPERHAEFLGFRRENGAGVRNEVWIIPTVGCVNGLVREIARQGAQFARGSVGGVHALCHPYGCSQLGDDLHNTQKALAGLVRHPNAGGVLVVGLGCENNLPALFEKELGAYDPQRVRFLLCQQEEDELAAGVRLVRELCEYAGAFQREPCDASLLTVGLKCGGSDGLSGVTANPLVGAFTDVLIACGGSALLTEVPEMFGAESLLLNRCRDRSIFEQANTLIANFKRYYLEQGEKVDENPSPGNREGGITTLAEKSLGCVQKGGRCAVQGVLRYGEPAARNGLQLLEAPGNDLVASTALAASGAQIILFTTGRGTPYGSVVPTVKISSNPALFQAKKRWIDLDAGRLLRGEPMAILKEELFRMVLAVASGEKRAKAEAFDKSDLALFKNGVTL
jgi:altronate hydrolase